MVSVARQPSDSEEGEAEKVGGERGGTALSGTIFKTQTNGQGAGVASEKAKKVFVSRCRKGKLSSVYISSRLQSHKYSVTTQYDKSINKCFFSTKEGQVTGCIYVYKYIQKYV